MRKLKCKKLIIVITVLAFILSFSGNAFAYSNNQNGPQVLGEKKYISTIYKSGNLSKLSDSNKVIKKYAAMNFEISSYDDLKSKVAYIVQNRITDANFHITYKCGSDFNYVIEQQLKGLWHNLPVDDYTNISPLSWAVHGNGYDGDFNLSVKYTYVETKDQADYVETQVKQILSQIIKPGMSDLEKEKAIHDYIILNTALDETSTDTDIKCSAYNAITKHSAVGLGYALLCYKMLTDAGIEARIVMRYNFGEDGYAWNMVKIGGIWYHLDCTCDDRVSEVKGSVGYDYFNKTGWEIDQDGAHHMDDTKYPIAGTEFDTSFFASIDSVTLKNSEIDVKTSNIKNNTSIKFSLIHEDDNDASKTDYEEKLSMVDDDSKLVVSNGAYVGDYVIPDYVPEGNYKIKVTIGDQTAYSNVFPVKRDSAITVNNLKDSYIGNDLPETLTGSITDKDGISTAMISLEDAHYNYVDLTTGQPSDNSTKTIELNSDGTFSVDIPALNKIANGKFTIVIDVIDSNGNDTTREISFTNSGYDWNKILNDKPWKTKYSSYTELKTLMNVDANKKFTVKFSQSFNFYTLSCTGAVKIIDAQSGDKIPSVFNSLTSKSVQIIPKSSLTAGRVYYIVIDKQGIESLDGENLKNGVVCPFKVTDN